MLIAGIVAAQKDSITKHTPKIDNRSVLTFTPDSASYIISSIQISGNKTTRNSIIMREVALNEGDTIQGNMLWDLMEESRQNLRNISLFNFVEVTASLINDRFVAIDITVIEQWFIWPKPTLSFADRNFNSWLKNGYKFNRLIFGIDFIHKNFLGLRHQINTYIQVGYDQKYTLYYQIPFLNPAKTLGIRFGGGYALQREVAFNANENNKQLFVKPTTGYASQHAIGLIELIYRPLFHDNFFLGMGYDYYITADTVFQSNPQYMPDSIKNRQQYLSPYFLYKHDQRDYKHYPLKGYFLEFQAKWYAFQMISSTAQDIATVDVKANWYQPIAQRWFFNTGVHFNGVVGNNVPYFLQNGLGYGRDFVRGYEYYIINGQYYGLWKNNFKFAVVSPKTHQFGFIKSKKFSAFHYALYLNAFFDMGYVIDPHPTLQRQLNKKTLFGGGIGIDFATYYDFVFRIEASANRDGKIGLYLHLDAPL